MIGVITSMIGISKRLGSSLVEKLLESGSYFIGDTLIIYRKLMKYLVQI